MEVSFRDLTIAVGVIGIIVFGFTSMPDHRHEHEWQRADALEDRKHSDDAKKTAIAELRACYAESDSQYSLNWAKACRSTYEHNITQCLRDNVPEGVCRSKINYNADCELSSGKADMVNGYHDSAKSECRTMMTLELK